ncbi:MAG: hypothetical protein ABSC76_16610 [Terracidiphilus sp.]
MGLPNRIVDFQGYSLPFLIDRFIHQPLGGEVLHELCVSARYPDVRQQCSRTANHQIIEGVGGQSSIPAIEEEIQSETGKRNEYANGEGANNPSSWFLVWGHCPKNLPSGFVHGRETGSAKRLNSTLASGFNSVKITLLIVFESASHGTQDNPHSGNFLAARMGVLRALESVFMEVSEGDQRTLTASFRVKYCVLTRAPDNLMQPIPLAVATLEDMLVAA